MAQPPLLRDVAAPPSIRQQLRFMLNLYQSLSTIFFLLVEQRASTSPSSTRAALATQAGALRDLLAGREGTSAVERQVRVQQNGVASSEGLRNLRPEHGEQVGSLELVRSIAQHRHVLRSGVETAYVPTISQVTSALQTVDAVMSDLMRRARRHAVNQARIQGLITRIEAREAGMVGTIRRLSTLRDRCKRLVRLGEQEAEGIRRAEERPMAYDDVLRYGRTLSQTTTAPPGFTLPTTVDDDNDDAAAGAAAATGGANTSDEKAKGRKTTMYELGAGDSAQAAGGGGMIPAHLQDKLPFPSVDAIRRGASEVRPPTWAMFKRGLLAQPDAVAEEDEGGGEGARGSGDTQMDDESREQQQRQKRAQAAAHQQQQQKAATATAHKPAAAPIEPDEDEFGLDLN